MKKTILLILITLFSIPATHATEHHSGHVGGSGGGSGGGGACMKPRLADFQPAHLATVVPGAEFSFRVSNIDQPEQIAVTIKDIAVEITAEYKEPYYVIRGKIPPSLHDTAARINIKVRAKSPHCEAENGWLIIISG